MLCHRIRFPRYAGDAFTTNLEGLAGFYDIATRKGCTPAQLALAWLHKQGDDVFPIPGTKSASRIAENVGESRSLVPSARVPQIHGNCGPPPSQLLSFVCCRPGAVSVCGDCGLWHCNGAVQILGGCVDVLRVA